MIMESIFRRVDDVHLKKHSLVIRSDKKSSEVIEEIARVLNSTGWQWKSEQAEGVKHYVGHVTSFEIADSVWVLGVTVELVEDVNIRIDLAMARPDIRLFRIILHPGYVKKGEIRLDNLLSTTLFALVHIVHDIIKFRGLVNLADSRLIVVYHDKRWPTRIDLILKQNAVPYNFVVSYNIDAQISPPIHLSMSYGIITEKESSFDVLKDAIVDEYWKEFIGGGEGG